MIFDARIIRALALFIALIVLGTVGYRLIEGWPWLECFWMVLITFTTIGYGEVRPLSVSGRVFSIGLIVGGVTLFSYLVSQVSIYMLEGGFRRDLLARRRRQRMHNLRNHHIIVGYGRLGREVALELLHHKVAVVVIDTGFTDSEAVEDLEAQGLVVIEGDATHDAVLREAHITNARGLAATTGSNAINILVTISARQLNPTLQILTRVDTSEDVPKARRAGATSVVVPHGLAGVNMAQGLLRPEARTFLDLALMRSHQDLVLEDIAIGPDSPCQGSLRDLRVRERFKVAVVALRKVQHQDMMTLPDANTVLEVGDIAVVVGRLDNIRAFAQYVG